MYLIKRFHYEFAFISRAIRFILLHSRQERKNVGGRGLKSVVRSPTLPTLYMQRRGTCTRNRRQNTHDKWWERKKAPRVRLGKRLGWNLCSFFR
jgi:hypothetical protein